MCSQSHRAGPAESATALDFSAIGRDGAACPETITVSAPNRDGLLVDLEARLKTGRGFSLATLNLDHLVKIGHDPAFRAAYAAQTHVTADGNPVVWLCRIAGQEVSLVPGSELVEPIAEIAARRDFAVAMVGSTEDSLKGAADELAARCPGLRVVARIAPAMGFDPDGAAAADCIAALEASGAQICFLALGAPKQEIFAARAQQALPGVGFLSIGAGLDFLSGAQTRAPALIRVLAMEWLWRLAGNPSRLLARYLACFMILPAAMCAALRARQGGHS